MRATHRLRQSGCRRYDVVVRRKDGSWAPALQIVGTPTFKVILEVRDKACRQREIPRFADSSRNDERDLVEVRA
jgi:hypothetical protein